MNTWFDTDTRLLERLRGRMNRLFSEFFEDYPRTGGNGFRSERNFPPLNFWEDKDNVLAECEIPGVRVEDLEVLVVGRDLTIKGVRKPSAVEGAAYHRRELDGGAFQRVVTLPVEVDGSKVKAELTNGVLTLTLPKAPEAKPRTIEVKVTGR